MDTKKIKIIATGGGTGGHIYPAIAVIEAVERLVGKENVEALFIGAEGKMEMNIVPSAGYRVVGLPVRGLKRKLTLENITIAINFLKSLFRSYKILNSFNPEIIIGFGGYASAPIFFAARNRKIKRFLWEGNSFAGAANRALGRYASKIFVSYDNMNRFFEDSKIVKTGNPIRATFAQKSISKEDALAHFSLPVGKKVILITGGSLGARVLNEGVMNHIDSLIENDDIALIWQTGSYYIDEMRERCKDKKLKNIWIGPFIDNMKAAYKACDLIVCRSGASTVTEVALESVPALFVPSSGVTDDHQTKNAMALVEVGAAAMLKDCEAIEKMVPTATQLLQNKAAMDEMASKMGAFTVANGADIIASTIVNL